MFYATHYKPGVHASCDKLILIRHASVQFMFLNTFTGTSLGMPPANERRRYIVTTSPIGCAHTSTDSCFYTWATQLSDIFCFTIFI